MNKLRIRTKHKKIIKWSLIIGLLVLVFFVLIGGIRQYQDLKLVEDALLLSAEMNTYEERLQEVESINNRYDYTLNGYEKLIEENRVNTLIISDTGIGANNRYEIKPQWQEAYEAFINGLNNQENRFTNILLRGSNIMWAYMQVSSDLSNKDFDFAVIEISHHELEQLGEETFILYYEGLIRQLYKQFDDIKVMVVVDETIIESLSGLNRLNNDFLVSTIVVKDSDSITHNIKAIVEEDLDLQKSTKESILSRFTMKTKQATNSLYSIKGLSHSLLPTESEGFMIKQGLFFNNAVINHLTYEAENDYIFLNYVTFVDGCEIDVYINEILYVTLDSYSEITGVGVLALPLDSNKRTITIIAKSDSASGKYLMMDNLLVGY